MNNPYYLKDTDGFQYPEFQIWEEGRQVGIKEVVEWITHYNDDITLSEMRGLDCWNEKLKEWGCLPVRRRKPTNVTI